MFAMLFRQENTGLLLALASLWVLAVALFFQHVGGLQPCVLCIYQRWPWLAAAIIGAAAWRLRANPLAHKALLAAGALALTTGAAIAIFHVGVEQGFWAGTAECGGQSGQAQTVEELKRQLLATEVVRCDEVAWSLAGISMAGYNLLLSLLGAGYLGRALTRN